MTVGAKDVPSRRRRVLRRIALAGVSLTAVTGLAVTTGAGSAAAATAHLTGRHYVCAASLTVHNNGDVGALGQSIVGGQVVHDVFDIDHFGDGINHAWGYGYHYVPGLGWQAVAYGWVYNGWFC